MDKDKKKIIAGAAILGGTGLAALLLRRKREEEVPPGEDYGRARGYVLDAETNDKIINAIIYLDGVFQGYSNTEGTYLTDYILFGVHTLTVEANNYQKTDFPFTINESLMRLDLALPHINEAPTEWTEGVEVVKITAEPIIVSVGDIVHIGVYIRYPDPLPLPVDIHGSVLVNGTLLSGDWTLEFRNPTLALQYQTVQAGEFVVQAQDKSASFSVVPTVSGHYYSPFGKLVPWCTEITIPDVPPFVNWISGIDHPGGDLKWPMVRGWHNTFLFPESVVRQIGSEKLSEAQATKWEPASATIRTYDRVVKAGSPPGNWWIVKIQATDYDCQEYFDNLSELVKYLADTMGTPPSICGSGKCTPQIRCPYGDHWIRGAAHTQGLAWDKVSFWRGVLAHIEAKHPDHPLTEPAWY
jgi:hypothetical protein